MRFSLSFVALTMMTLVAQSSGAFAQMGLINQMMQQAIQAEQQRQVLEERRRAIAEEERRRAAAAARARKEEQAQIAAEKKAAEQRRAADKAEQERQQKLARVTPGAQQVIGEASEFIKANPSHPKVIQFVEGIATLNTVLKEGDPAKVEKQTTALSSELQKDAAFAQFVLERAEMQRQENARYLADAMKLAKAQKEFVVGYIARNATSPDALALLPLVKQIDSALEKPNLVSLKPLTEKVDLSIRQQGLRTEFVATLASFTAQDSGATPSPNPAQPAPTVKVGTTPTGTADIQLATTDKNRFLIDGDLNDIVLMFNSTSEAPHVVKNLRGEIVFDGAKADVCLYQRDPDAEMANIVRRALGRYNLKSITVDAKGCVSERIRTYDVIAAKRGSFLRQEAQYSLSLVKEIELDAFKPLFSITDADLKAATHADSVKATEIEQDIERGAKDGYGLLLLSTQSPNVCAVVSTKTDGHRRVLLSMADRLATEMNASPTVVTTSLDSAFVSIKRSQCGAVYASASDLKDLLPALKRDAILYRVSTAWVSQDDVTAADTKVAQEKQLADQQALERQRKAEEERKLLDLRAADEAKSKAAMQAALQAENGKTARAAAAVISDEVKQAVEGKVSPATNKYPGFMAWFQDQQNDRWELMTFNADLFDYGRSDWKGRNLETGFAKVSMRLRNRVLGEYKDTCFIFGHLVDSEFGRTRDPVVLTCDDQDPLLEWKRGHQFQSKWLAE